MGNGIVSVSILGSLLLIAILILIFYSIRDTSKSLDIKFAISCILLIVSVVLFGILISILITPYFHVRYMVPILGSLWLGVSILLAKSYDKKYLFIPILILILVCSCVGAFTFYEAQICVENVDHNELEMLKGYVGNDSVIICDCYSDYMVFDYHFANGKNYLINFSDNPMSRDGISKEKLNIEISKILANNDFGGKPIYFVQLRSYDDLPLVTENYTLTKVDTIKDFPFSGAGTNIYRVNINI